MARGGGRGKLLGILTRREGEKGRILTQRDLTHREESRPAGVRKLSAVFGPSRYTRNSVGAGGRRPPLDNRVLPSGVYTETFSSNQTFEVRMRDAGHSHILLP